VIAGLVLAAGGSSRMGSLKVLLPVAGRPLVRYPIDAAIAAGLDDVVVVVGRDAELVSATVLGFGIERVRTVDNEAWETGQASSLRAGLNAMTPDADAAVVMLADQPTIQATAIAAVVDGFRVGAGPVVQASYGGRPRWRTLVEVGGDLPADVDTQADYERMRQWMRRASGS
jgi:CTP:molybdopterin cytidylyltransferase MocA